MANLFPVLFAILAGLNWLAAWRGQVEREYLVKPGAIIALILFAATKGELSLELGLALGACLLGDIFLMLPGDYFLAGLASFFCGQVAYSLQFPGAFNERLVWFAVVSVVLLPVSYLV